MTPVEELAQLEGENARLRAELAKAENERLKAQLDSVRAAASAPTEVIRGMTLPAQSTIIHIPHDNDPKTNEKISTTIRQDFGYDPHQRFVGRQP